jgi:formylglycine-generating enzyme required for sulfatase activity/serine/threonine protein kinase
MLNMDRQKAFAVLGLPDDASRDEIDALVADRRRKLRQRIVFATTAEQREFCERALAELENAHSIAILADDGRDSRPPAGARIALASGKTLGDRYVIRRRIGYGENGAVFAALDLSWGKEIAIKVLRPELLLVPGTYARLDAAVRSVYELAHSGVVSVYGLTKLDGYTAIAMELLPERNLRALMAEAVPAPPGARRGGLPMSHIIDIVQGICAALEYARKTTLHLNLKPDNVFVTDEGFVKLSDFGLDPILGPALQITSPTAREQRRYRAPEVARRAETGATGTAVIDERADEYSVAAIAHYLLIAAAPYPDPSAFALRHMGLEKSLAQVLSKALSSDPRDRYATLDEFRAAFLRATLKRTSKRVFMTVVGACGVAAALLSGTALLTGMGNPVAPLIASVTALITGDDERGRANREVVDLQERVLALSSDLTATQNELRRDWLESRINVRAKAQAVEFAESPEQRAEADARYAETLQDNKRLIALREIAMPEIFNSADTLNAYNLIGLANDHLTAGRYDEARTVFARAEAVLTDKLRSYEQAEKIVAQQILASTNTPNGDQNSAGARPDQMRRDLQSATQSRRQWAAAIQARMVTIPGGTYAMGDVNGIGGASEGPVHTVLVPEFQLSAYEVTRSDYAACVGEGGCSPLVLADQTRGNVPVTGLSWFDAQDYVLWLSDKTGEVYRLPSEAEWEYAARSATDTVYPWGMSVGSGEANCINCGSPWDGIAVAPVGSFKANGFGLYDMAGNAWEWTADCWHSDYVGAPAIAIARSENAICAERVLRGGSYENDAWLARTTYRGRGRSDTRNDLYGLRVAKSVD